MIDVLPESLFVNIWMVYIDANKSSCRLRTVCKRFKTYTDIYGYIKNISCNRRSNIQRKLSDYKRHMPMMVRLHMTDTFMHFMNLKQKLPKTVYITNHREPIHCISPNCVSNTERLSIVYTAFENTLLIDWDKFPNLKQLDISAHNVDLEGIQYLQHIVSIRIVIRIRQSKWTNTKIRSELPSLKYLQFSETDVVL